MGERETEINPDDPRVKHIGLWNKLKEVTGDEIISYDFLMARDLFGKIFKEARGKIDNHAYTSIIGDDVSGRIPARIAHRALNEIYRARDQQQVPLTFLAASKPKDFGQHEKYEQKWVNMASYIKEHRDDYGENPLLITESISEGGTVRRYQDVFCQNGLQISCFALTKNSAANTELTGDVNIGMETNAHWVLHGLSRFQTAIDRGEVDQIHGEAMPLGKSYASRMRQAAFLVAGDLTAEYLSEAGEIDGQQ